MSIISSRADGSRCRFAWTAACVGALWNIGLLARLVLPYDVRPLSVVILGVLGLAPYITLALLTRFVRSQRVLKVGLVAQLSTHGIVGLDAMRAESSTAGIALILQPLVALVVLLPSVIFVDGLLRRPSE